MVGVLTDPIQVNEGIAAQGLDAMPVPLSESLGATAADAWARSPGPGTLRWLDRQSQMPTAYGATGTGFIPQAPMLSRDEATRRFGIDGHLSFDNDVPAPVAQDLYDLKRAELERQSIQARGPSGILPGIAHFATGLGVSVFDPTNIAAMFIPAVGEIRAAEILGLTGATAGARFAARAAAGAVDGAVGAAALQPLVYGLARSEQADYHAVDALLSIAYGGVLGGGLHAGLGAVGDMVRGRKAPAGDPAGTVHSGEPGSPVTPPDPVSAAVDRMPIEDRQALLQTAVGELACEGRVRSAGDVFAAADQRLRGALQSVVMPPEQGLRFDRAGITEGAVLPPEDVGTYIHGYLAPRGFEGSRGDLPRFLFDLAPVSDRFAAEAAAHNPGFADTGGAPLRMSNQVVDKLYGKFKDNPGTAHQIVANLPELVDGVPLIDAGGGRVRAERLVSDGSRREVAVFDLAKGKDGGVEVVSIGFRDPPKGDRGRPQDAPHVPGGEPQPPHSAQAFAGNAPTVADFPSLPVADNMARPSSYVEVDPRDVGVDAKTFQFKAGGDDHGVTKTLQGVTQWDQHFAGLLMMYQDHQGKLWVADGHQRVGLAKRLADQGQDVRLTAMILRAEDGHTPGSARVLAALKNMAEGTGSAIDGAKVLRDIAEDASLRSHLRSMPPLPPQSALVRDATALARLKGDAFGMVVNGHVREDFAAQVGRLIDDPAEQLSAMKVLSKVGPKTANEARFIVEQVREAGFVARSEGKQGEMFGAQAMAHALYGERARVLDNALGQLKKDRATFKMLTERADAIAEAGNQLSHDSNAARLDHDQRLLDIVSQLATRRGPLADALNDAARAVHDGGRVGPAARGFLDAAKEAVGRGDLGGDSRGEPGRGPEGVGPQAGGAGDRVGAGAADGPDIHGAMGDLFGPRPDAAPPPRLMDDAEISAAATAAVKQGEAKPLEVRAAEETQAARETLGRMAESGQLDRAQMDELARIDAEAKDGEGMAKAYEAAGVCLQKGLF